MRIKFKTISLAAMSISAIFVAPVSAQSVPVIDETDAAEDLSIETTSLMCISSYIWLIVDQGKTVSELPDSHPLFFWRDIGEFTAVSNDRDWLADFTIVTEYNLTRRGLLGDKHMADEDKKIIEHCDDLQKAIEAEIANPDETPKWQVVPSK